MNATGNWLDSLETEARENVGVIRGQDYSEFLARGRANGNMPPVNALIPWVNAKLGLYGSEATSAAWGIAKKIAAEGTSWYQKGGSDLLEVLESDEVISFIQGEYKNLVRVEVVNSFERMTREIFV